MMLDRSRNIRSGRDRIPENQAEQDLRDSQARLRLALDASGIALWDADFVTGLVLLDARWAELIGEEPRETSIPFRRLLKQVAPEERPAAEHLIRTVLRGDHDDYQMQYRVRHASGRWVWIESRGRVIARDENGRAIRMIGTNTDITAEKEAEAERRRQTEALVRQRDFLEALHQTSLELLKQQEMDDLLQAIVDRSAALLDAPFGELSLVDGDEFVVRAFTRNQNFLLGDRVGRQEALLSWKVHDTGQVLVVDDYLHHEERRHIYDSHPRRAVAIFPILHGPRCLGVLGLSRTRAGHTFSAEEIERGAMLAQQAALVVHNADVYDDAVRVAEQALERLRQSHKIELLGNLAGGIAHDFNNILTGMLSNVELARMDISPDHPARQWVDRIGATAGHAKNLVQQILTFSRMGEGKLAPTRLQPVVAAAVELMRTTMPSMMRIEADIDDTCLPVLADETQIHQVVLNLCTNAWHALPEHGGSVAVTLSPLTALPESIARQHPELRAGPYVLLSVSDNGCGMDTATLQRIYEPFFTTKDTGKGTGLGLAVTHGIVKSHGGLIAVESVPGVGTTFEICLPALDATASPVVVPAGPSAAPVRGQNERLLYVDDEAGVGMPLRHLLERLGYRVTYETDPKIALALFRSRPQEFDLIITDLAMPGMTGRELAAQALDVRSEIPIILLTGMIEPRLREELMKIGVRSVLTKPATLGELASSIAAALGR